MDYAWNLQVEDYILRRWRRRKGVAQFAPGGKIERLVVNFTDPRKEVEGARRALKTPHPFLTEIWRRRGAEMSWSMRSLLKSRSTAGYGIVIVFPERPSCFVSKNMKTESDEEKASDIFKQGRVERRVSMLTTKDGLNASRLEYQLRSTPCGETEAICQGRGPAEGGDRDGAEVGHGCRSSSRRFRRELGHLFRLRD